MLEVNKLTIRTGADRLLIEDASFSIGPGDKLAIIGEEGNGKSTLLKAIADPESIADYAEVSGVIRSFGHSIGYVAQTMENDWLDQPIPEFFLKDRPKDEPDYDRYQDFALLPTIFSQLHLSPALLEETRKLGSLSGGEKVKLQFAKVLLKDPEILVLDEPTNDLDLNALNFLETFINSRLTPVLFVSHDEYLLEKTANCILHIEQVKRKSKGVCTFDRLGYEEYVEKRLHGIDKQRSVAFKERDAARQRQKRWNEIYSKVHHDQNAISRQDPHGGRLLKKKMKSVKAQQKRYEREAQELTEIPDVEEPSDVFFEACAFPAGRQVIDFALERLAVGTRILSSAIRLTVTGPEKISIIGANGSGKTTLLRQIYAQLADKGAFKTGYMPQDYEEAFAGIDTVTDYIRQYTVDAEDFTRFRTLLGRLKFTPEEMEAKLTDLSSGQKAKLFIGKLIFMRCNVLVLDEPTRNLSPLTNPIIRDIFAKFSGAVIVVTHDRKLIDSLGGPVYQLSEKGLLRIV